MKRTTFGGPNRTVPVLIFETPDAFGPGPGERPFAGHHFCQGDQIWLDQPAAA